ncbi:MAG: hypothetical protein ABJ205_05165 [Erythrobacter sp.]|uniref:hypothetical protein n=1 Tax=Erythrobacter sp. TaxID=1042 RepID=UPI003298DB8B
MKQMNEQAKSLFPISQGQIDQVCGGTDNPVELYTPEGGEVSSGLGSWVKGSSDGRTNGYVFSTTSVNITPSPLPQPKVSGPPAFPE